MRLTFLLIAAMLALAGCGKKGDLFLPDQSKPAQTQPSPK
jgi:predicted small lipoprotein YifL